MPLAHRATIVLASVVLLAPLAASTQPGMPPVNDRPNPYRTVEGWAKMPEGRSWGSTSAVDIDRDGVSIWVGERCGQNDCVGSTLDPVLKFDANGNLVRNFGAGMILSPHGIHVDRDGNVWVTDCSCTGRGGGGRGGRGGAGRGGAGRGGDTAGRGAAPPAPPAPAIPSDKGHQVYKFAPDGRLLMTLGKGGGGRDTAYFWQPNDVVTAPNGDIYVAEGHSSQQKQSPARILKFDRTGKLLAVWGTVVDSTTKDQPHSFDQPHALAFDSRGRLYVGDRSYNRIKIFDQSGNLLDTWYQFSRPSGIYIDRNDDIYVTDSESGSVNPAHGAWTRGIRIGSVRDGVVRWFIPDPVPTCPRGQPSTAEAPCTTGTSAAEGVAVDSQGNVYGAEVGPRALKRYVKS
jgi:sugar lactone lactonase YvrE